MFTGLVDHCGIVQTAQKNEKTSIIGIRTVFDDLALGESIAVDGVCLTVSCLEDQTFYCEVSPETQQLTIVGDYEPGRLVNLERALRLSDRLGGHFVMGHVDRTGILLAKTPFEDYVEISIGIDEKRYLMPKGSIAVNGVSLTINEIGDSSSCDASLRLPISQEWTSIIKCMLIPHTLQKTNMEHLSIGDRVNIEFDWLAKLVQYQVDKP